MPHNIKLKIGNNGISCVKFHPNTEHLITATTDGRIRLYDYSVTNPQELYRKKWHNNIMSLDLSSDGRIILTASANGGIKLHDYETEKQSWSNLDAHDNEITAIISQFDNLFTTGDCEGIVKFWDSRQEDEICEINLKENKYLYGINSFSYDSNRRNLFVACDDGSLCTINGRKRKLDLRSEPLGASCKSVLTIKDQANLLVAMDDMTLNYFKWNQFGDISDRFPLLKNNNDQELECAVKINENLVAIGTNEGRIMSASVLPNRTLSDIGNFIDDPDNKKGQFAECMNMDVDPTCKLLAACCADSNVIKFFSLSNVSAESTQELNERAANKRKKDKIGQSQNSLKKQKINYDCFDNFFSNQDDDAESDNESNDEDIDVAGSESEEDVESIEDLG